MSLWHEISIVFFSYVMILAVVFFDRKFDVGFWKEILVSSLLSLVQLVSVGFLILFLLKLKVETASLLFVLLFFTNATFISMRRFKFKGYARKLGFLIVFSSIAIVSTVSLILLAFGGILKLKPNSIIPLAGIVTAAGMRSLSLAFSYFRTRLRDLEDTILGMLALGASDIEVFKFIFRTLIDDITVPVRDMLRSAGIVHIPGVMVGLLVAGVFPVKAAVVQFAILATMVFQFTFVPALALFSLVYLYGLKLEV